MGKSTGISFGGGGGASTNVDFGTPVGTSTGLDLGSSQNAPSNPTDLGTPLVPIKPPSHPGFLHFNDLTNAIGLGGAAHWVGNEVGTSTHDLENILIHGPGGAVHFLSQLPQHPIRTVGQFVNSVGEDFRPTNLVHHPIYPLIDLTSIADLGASTAGRAAAIRGITERAGAPAFDSLEAAKAAGQEVAYNRAINPVTGVQVPVNQQIRTALFRGAPAERRLINIREGNYKGEGGTTAQDLGDFARSYSWRTAQKITDRLHEAFPEARVPVLGSLVPKVFGSQAERVKSVQRAAMIYQKNALRRPASALVAAARGLSTPEQVAIRVVAEGASIPDRIRFHEQQIEEGGLNARQVAESKKQIILLGRAQKYIYDGEVGGRVTPLIRPEFTKLADIVDQSRLLSHAREGLIGNVLADPNAIGRKLNPLRVIMGESIPELPEKVQNELRYLKGFATKSGNPEAYADKIADAEARLKEAQHREQNPFTLGEEEVSPEYVAHLFRVPYATKPAFRNLLGGGARYAGGKAAPPSTVTHAFKAGYLKHGGGRNDITNLLAESYAEAARYVVLRQARDRILSLSYKSPQDLLAQGVKPENIVAINTDALKGGVSGDLMRQWRSEQFGGAIPEETLNADEVQAIGSQYDELRKQIFQEYNSSMEGNPNYVFADRRLLGGLDEPNPLTGINARAAGRSGLKFVDALNNSVKSAVLYLKPAYLFPNWLGNVALGLIHQGFAAPGNLFKAARLEHKIGGEAVSAIDTLMGGGITDTLLPQQGTLARISKGANYLGGKYGKVIDDPSRRAAFYTEAIRAGYDTPEAVKALVTKPEHVEAAQTIAQRAAKEIIDYEDLGPWEQSVIRRVVFFYPWVKGASRYGLHFFQNHPAASFVNAQFAKEGEKQQEEILGKLPAYAEGLIPFGHVKNNGLPITVNPASASILETPGDVLESLHNLFTGHPNKDLNLLQNLAPFDAALLTLASGTPTGGPDHPGETIFEKGLQQLYGGLPLATAVQSVTSPAGPGRVYPAAQGSYAGVPLNVLIALSRFGLFGGLTPRPYNPGAGSVSAQRETNSIP